MNALQTAQDYAGRAQTLSIDADELNDEIERIREQLDGFAQLASIGLTVEVLVHELRSIISSLEHDSSLMISRIKLRELTQSEFTAFVERVRTATQTMRKEILQLEPGLRFARERLDTIPIDAFLKNQVEYSAERVRTLNVSFVLHEPIASFSVRMNRGKLIQVFANLFANAEFWLVHDLERQFISSAEIHIKVPEKGIVEVWDNGRGIDPSVEAGVFEPFVTAKSPGEGHGLGMFVAREFLRTSGSSISLLPERNSFGRRFKFRIDLKGAINAD